MRAVARVKAICPAFPFENHMITPVILDLDDSTFIPFTMCHVDISPDTKKVIGDLEVYEGLFAFREVVPFLEQAARYVFVIICCVDVFGKK